MRKALIGMILAASVLTPAAVHAQQSGSDPVLERYQRVGERNRARVEARQERRESRQEVRRERREAVREQRRQQAAPPAAVMQQRDSRDARTDELRRRYERVGRENRRNYERKVEQRQLEEQRRREWAERRRDRRHWDRDWRHDRSYNWRHWRYRNRDLYRLPPYYAPYRGHRYSRFGIGIHLGRPFYSDRYRISDPSRYRLPYAPPGHQWVRYYDDVLLVDTWTGQVVDVIHDFFW